MKQLADDTINLLAQSLSKTSYWKQCTKIINSLYEQREQSFTELRATTKLSYTICREALLLLQGACFVDFEIEGRKSIYRLSYSGHRLFELHQILTNNKNQTKKGA